MVQVNPSLLRPLGVVLVMLLVVKLWMDRQIEKIRASQKQQIGQATKRVRLVTEAWIVGDRDEQSPTKA